MATARRVDFNGGLHRRGSQLEIQLAVLVHLQPDVFGLGGLETLQFHLDVVIGDAEQGNNVLAASLVVEDRDSPVAGAVTVTFAPGTADPVASVTVPEILPVACPYSERSRQGLSVSQRKPLWIAI